MAIITPGNPPTYYWVVASATTVKYTAKFNLTVPTLLQVEARVPLPPAQGDQCAAGVWVFPGQQSSSVPGFVVEIPGLAPGSYVAEITAQQISTGNNGTARMPFQVGSGA